MVGLEVFTVESVQNNLYSTMLRKPQTVQEIVTRSSGCWL